MLSWGEFVAIYGTAPIDRYIALQSMSPMSMQLLHNTVFWVNCKCTEFCWKRSLFINVTVYKVNKAQWDSEILPMSMAESSFYVEHICSYQQSSSCYQTKTTTATSRWMYAARQARRTWLIVTQLWNWGTRVPKKRQLICAVLCLPQRA